MKMYEYIKVICLTVCWYCISLLETVNNKHYFTMFPYILTLSLSHMIGNIVFLYPVLKLMQFKEVHVNLSSMKYVAYLGVLKVCTCVFSLYSLYLLSVSYSQTLRTLAPLISIVLSKIYYGETQTTKIYISIGFITAGVTLTSVTELSICYTGLLSSVLMVLMSVSASFYSRHYFKELNIHPLVMLLNIHFVAVVVIIPVWLAVDFISLLNDQRFEDVSFLLLFIRMLIFQGALSFVAHSFKFMLMGLVSAVAYTVINSAKSLSKIIVGFIFYANGFSYLNLFGSLFAVYGVVSYAYAKKQKNEIKKD